jgi:hypothetical protein
MSLPTEGRWKRVDCDESRMRRKRERRVRMSWEEDDRNTLGLGCFTKEAPVALQVG